METVSNLGLGRTARVGASYLKTKLSPARREETLEDFFINRFGHELYRTFFKDYTEKVWGIACSEISAEWGAQRIKGLSVSRALWHAIRKIFKKDSSIGQKGTDTSLIERFLYPKYGPGQLWEEVADKIRRRGGEIRMKCLVTGVDHDGAQIKSVTYWDEAASCFKKQECDYLFSSMPVDELIAAMGSSVPAVIQEVSAGLEHRDFMTVGLLVKNLKTGDGVANPSRSGGSTLIRDNWIYIQERDVKIGRLQIFNNWSPFMVKDREKVWLGLEYFCDEGDEMWRTADEDFISFAAEELAKIGMIDKDDVLDSVLIRQRKAYPAYFGSYHRFGEIRKYVDSFANMFLIGRNGMHKYNNQDHSMLTAMAAVENIQRGVVSKENIWAINAEEEYHEEKGDAGQVSKAA
jgi:protoporphyrinogen oxidase